jgi:hypothetical protein
MLEPVHTLLCLSRACAYQELALFQSWLFFPRVFFSSSQFTGGFASHTIFSATAIGERAISRHTDCTRVHTLLRRCHHARSSQARTETVTALGFVFVFC